MIFKRKVIRFYKDYRNIQRWDLQMGNTPLPVSLFIRIIVNAINNCVYYKK